MGRWALPYERIDGRWAASARIRRLHSILGGLEAFPVAASHGAAERALVGLFDAQRETALAVGRPMGGRAAAVGRAGGRAL